MESVLLNSDSVASLKAQPHIKFTQGREVHSGATKQKLNQTQSMLHVNKNQSLVWFQWNTQLKISTKNRYQWLTRSVLVYLSGEVKSSSLEFNDICELSRISLWMKSPFSYGSLRPLISNYKCKKFLYSKGNLGQIWWVAV